MTTTTSNNDRMVSRSLQVAIVLNLKASGGRAGRAWNEIASTVQRDYPNAWVLVETQYHRHAVMVVKQLIEEGYKLIVLIGGDGTINHGVNGYVMADGISRNVKLAIIPAGTGGDFSRTVGLNGLTPLECWEDVIMKGETRLIDVGRASYAMEQSKEDCKQGKEITLQESYFVNVASFGFSGHTVRSISHSYLSKIFARGLVYWMFGILVNLFLYSGRQCQYHLMNGSVKKEEMEGVEEPTEKREVVWEKSGKLYMGAVANGKYFGGGMLFSPQSNPTDGKFECTWTHDVSLLAAIQHVPSGLRQGNLVERLGNSRGWVKTCTSLEVKQASNEKPGDIYVELDGEYVGKLPAKFEMAGPLCCIILPPESH